MVDWKISVTDPGWEVKKPSTDAPCAFVSPGGGFQCFAA